MNYPAMNLSDKGSVYGAGRVASRHTAQRLQYQGAQPGEVAPSPAVDEPLGITPERQMTTLMRSVRSLIDGALITITIQLGLAVRDCRANQWVDGLCHLVFAIQAIRNWYAERRKDATQHERSQQIP